MTSHSSLVKDIYYQIINIQLDIAESLFLAVYKINGGYEKAYFILFFLSCRFSLNIPGGMFSFSLV